MKTNVLKLGDCDFSANAIKKIALLKPDYSFYVDFDSATVQVNTESATRKISVLRWWIPLPSISGNYYIKLSVRDNVNPNSDTYWAYALREVANNTARTGVDLLINQDSRTVDNNFSVSSSQALALNSASYPYLYLNINSLGENVPVKVTVELYAQNPN